jgi:ferrous iron transport protein B
MKLCTRIQEDIMGKFTIALVGNPNAGKTTLFNILTNSREYVGNWAGVTVEKRIGTFQIDSDEYTVVDLPGIYSLSPYSIEEVVSKDFIVKDKPDMVLNIVDASNLERNLYLSLQLLELGCPQIIALNMIDVVENMGNKIDIDNLSKMLGAPIVSISASKVANIDELINKIVEKLNSDNKKSNKADNIDSNEFKEYFNLVKDKINFNSNSEESEELVEKRYGFINKIVEHTMNKPKSEKTMVSDNIDKVLTNKYLAIPIFIFIFYLLFKFTFSWIGQPISNLLGKFITKDLTVQVTSFLEGIKAAPWLRSLIVDGIIAGVGGIVVFFPLIFTLFFFISILEDSGYMSRIAFILDKAMTKIGLSGKAFIPLILGFGCSVPAIMSARTMENEKDKKLLTLIIPFMSCNARLPVYALFTAIFFKGHEALVIISLYLLGIIMAVGMGYIFKNTLFKGEVVPFIMELPRYKLPNLKGLCINSWERSKEFLQRAGTIIFGMSVLVWFLSNFNFRGMTNLPNSFLAYIGKFIAPIFALTGFGNWKAAVSLLAGLLSKEVVVSTMNVIYSFGGSVNNVSKAIQNDFTPLSAYAFMVFVLLYTPCVSAVATVKKELNSWKWAGFSVVYQLLTALVMAIGVYQIGRLLGF